MQCNLVNDQEQVAQFAWRGVRCVGVAIALGLISRVWGACSVCGAGCFLRAYSGSFSGQRLPCILGVRLRMSTWLCLAQRSVGWRFGVLSSISPPSSPYSGDEGPRLNSFSIELTVQCDGCLFWGLGERAWLGCGLGRLIGCSTDLGLGC